MQFSSWKRHQLRAMGGRNRSLARAGGAIGGAVPIDVSEPAPAGGARKDSASKAAQLLNFLAKTAAQSQRELLSPTPVPDFARSAANIDQDLNQFLAQKRRSRLGLSNSAPNAQSAPDRSAPEQSIRTQSAPEQSATARSAVTQSATAGSAVTQSAAEQSAPVRSALAQPEPTPAVPAAALNRIADVIAQSTAAPLNGEPADNLLGALAEALSEEAITATPPTIHYTQEAALLNAMSSFNLHALEMLPETDYETDHLYGFTAYGGKSLAIDDYDEEIERSFDCVADLDKWLSGGSDLEEDYDDSTINDPFLTPRTLPAALPPVMPSSDFTGFDDVTDIESNDDVHAEAGDDQAEPAPKSRHLSPSRSHRRDSRYRRALFNKTVMYKPRLTTMRDGARRERFDNGAELTKDPLGRVVEVRAGYGATVQLRYDEEGQPDSFIRCDSNGETHSLGERGKHGVVVRDPEGRVRAAGESMAVDPTGCVSVRREDGQFWSLDLVRGVHIERRRITVPDGAAHVLTAIFASDGFRMVTRFQNAQDRRAEGDCGKQWLAEEPSGTFRFYGRDGSVVQFDSEDDLVELRPSNVWQPGSRFVETSWKGYHQAGTAWESVQEYVTNYLLA